jgi:F-type H+-transporting ATPase subunit delta
MAVVDSRYARAFAAVVASQKLDSKAAESQLQDFAATLNGSGELREILENPSISEDQKLKVLDAIAGRIGMLPAVRNFVAVITHHNRLHELGDIVAAYHTIADETTNVLEAEIVSARPLDADNRELLERQVAVLAGHQVNATYSQDASLLGGVVVKIGSTVYDGSVRAQLQQLKQKMIAATLQTA